MLATRYDETEINHQKIIDQIRCLGIDMIDEAQSGHPGIVLGAAPIMYTLFAHHMNIDPEHPKFFGRDRFIMSAGHGSALLYAILYFCGFDISLNDLKDFRKIDSKTPGHPQYKTTPGVDATTGPLGQGLAMAVGMAIAEAKQENIFNDDKNKLIDYYTYALVSDGDLMEGISYEACSLAGSLKLNKLIVLYDSNSICIDGNIDKTFNEDISLRFSSQGWNVITVNNGEDIQSINDAIEEAKNSVDKPTIIQVKTTIGKYSSLEGTNAVHGVPLSKDDISKIKTTLNIRDIPFTVSQNACDDMRYILNKRCVNLVKDFDKKYEKLSDDKKNLLNIFISDDKTISMNDLIYEAADDGIESPRNSSGKILNSIVPNNIQLFGGSADLFANNKTYVNGIGDFSAENRAGRNIFFGVREHAMAAIANGLALCGFRPYVSTLMAFSDYMKPSIRLSAMMKLPVIYIFTHDSISIGPDGPTHQPVEQLNYLRTLPNMEVYRPADTNEVIGTYRSAFQSENPVAIILSKNSLPILENTKVNEVENGGYILYEPLKKPECIVISSGEEIHQVLDVAKRLETKAIPVRVVSMPNLIRFLNQDEDYIENILPVEIRKIVVETSTSYIWSRLIFNSKYIIGLDNFGKSGSKDEIYKELGYDVESLEERIENLLK